MIKNEEYKYPAFPFHIVDGDTFDAFVILVDYGFNRRDIDMFRFRLKEIDTWENKAIKGDQEHKKKGILAEERTRELIEHKWIDIETFKDPGKYGRWLARVELPDGKYLFEMLRIEGHEKIKD